MKTSRENKASALQGILAKFGLIGLVALLILVAPVVSSSQTCCSGGVPLGGSLGLGAADGKSLQVLVTYDYNAINDLVSFSDQLEDDTRSRTTQSSIIEINYGINQRWSLTGVIPFIRQTRTIQAFSGEDFTAAQGIGDVVFLAKFRPLNPEYLSNFDLVVAVGPKLPTARTDHESNQGLTLAADMQPGSGSLDGIFWSFFQKGRLLNNPKLGLVGLTTFRYSGVNNNYNGSQSYRFGNEFQLSLGLNYSLFLTRPVDVFAFVRYRSQTEDRIDGGSLPSSGGKWVTAIPGVNIFLASNWSLRLSGDIPLYRKLEGTQLTTSYKLTAALLFNIPFNGDDKIIN